MVPSKQMGLYFTLFLSFSFLLFSLCTYSQNPPLSNQLTQTFHFADPQVEQVGGAGGVQWIRIEGTTPSIGFNKPTLPMKQAKILLPYGSHVQSVKIMRSQSKLLAGITNLRVSGRMLHLSSRRDYPVDTKSFAQLEFTKNYPEAGTYRIEQTLHGFSILLVDLNPVYIDTEKNVFFTNEMKVEIALEEEPDMQARSLQVFSTSKNRVEEVKNFVDNPDMLDSYPLNFERDLVRGVYDYLIVSSAELLAATGENTLTTLKNYLETKRALKVKTADIKTILQTNSGIDDATKLRNYIKTEYQNNNIRYVLLAGDADSAANIIPIRQFYSKVMGYNGQWEEIEGRIVSDFYYACLDGDFNGNGNDKWGEPTDGVNGGDVDMLCEVTVGRMPVSTQAEVANIVKKTIRAYEKKISNSNNKSVLMAGEVLFKDLNLWGDDYMEKLIGTSQDHGYTTNGYDQTWNFSKLYDKQRTWSGSDIKRQIDNGNFLMVNHLGHSNTSYALRINAGWFYQPFKNRDPFFLYTQGCFPGLFTANDSITEKFLLESNGTFASISNSNYGLGPEDPDAASTTSPGASQMLHRFFINHLMSGEKAGKGLQFATAHQKSKESMIPYADHEEARWVLWVANYFGDPALEIH